MRLPGASVYFMRLPASHRDQPEPGLTLVTPWSRPSEGRCDAGEGHRGASSTWRLELAHPQCGGPPGFFRTPVAGVAPGPEGPAQDRNFTGR
jgi:hypothetical protein